MAYIQIVLPDLRAGGLERVRTQLTAEFTKNGHRVSMVLFRRRGELLDIIPKDVLVYSLEVDRGREAIRPLSIHFQKTKPDVVLSGLWPLTAITVVALRLARHRCRLVLSEHNQLSQQYANSGWLHMLAMRTSLALAHRLADQSVAVSQGVAKDLEALALLSSGYVHPIPNPIAPSFASEADLSRADALWAAPKGARILNVGTLKKQKNHELLLRAFARLNQPAKTLMIVGEGAESTTLKSLAQELGIQDQVRFPGFQNKTAAFYQTADLFALSSNYEGMPNVLGEALASGINIVSTDCPSGPREILEAGLYGRLTPVGDIAAFHDAMQTALSEPLPSAMLVDRARMFTPASIAQKYLSALKL